jgi:hypothetical protein
MNERTSVIGGTGPGTDDVTGHMPKIRVLVVDAKPAGVHGHMTRLGGASLHGDDDTIGPGAERPANCQDAAEDVAGHGMRKPLDEQDATEDVLGHGIRKPLDEQDATQDVVGPGH